MLGDELEPSLKARAPAGRLPVGITGRAIHVRMALLRRFTQPYAGGHCRA